MPFLNQYQKKEKVKKSINTSPTKSEVQAAKEQGIDLGKSWNAYSREIGDILMAMVLKLI